jgi:UDP-GlcNAc:undecaprenyl-phosphate GlcNAc-1-phosphate transferase
MFWDHEMSKWLAMVIACVVTAVLLVSLRPLALRIGLIDNPDKRKLHQGQVPLIGGIGMFCGFVFACALLPVNLQNYRALLAAAGLLVLIGILDDFKELSPKSRLMWQLLAAFFVVAWGRVVLCDLGDLFAYGDIVLPLWVGWGLSLLAIVSLTNASNMMDGLDGLAGLLSLIAATGLLVLAVWHQNAVMASVLGILVAVLIVFLYFNFQTASRLRVFMGDAGSMFLGVVLAWFAIKGSQDEPMIARPVSMLWLLAIPLCELLTIVSYRLWQRRSPMKASRDHVHYLLLRYLKWPAWQVSLLFGLVGIIAVSIGVLGEIYKWQEWMMFLGFLVFFAFYTLAHLWLVRQCKE